MVDRLLVDLASDGRASVSAWREGDDFPDRGPSFELTWPLDSGALSDLRWYLEDYLVAPFGVYEERGPHVQAQLAEWGEAVFSALFATGPARDAYVGLRHRLATTELVFRSSSPAMLGLPWELMRDPAHPTPLALDLAGMSRSLPNSELARSIAVPGGRFRVLMVISRPAGTQDVGYQMIARPLLRRLEAVRGEVDLVVLRPPTLDALAETLAAAAAQGEPFQVVHFDGHGIFNQHPATGHDRKTGRGPEGFLMFEKPGGGPDEVSASALAQVLKAARIPVVVLNACQSGAIGKDLEAAIASRLLQEGTASVVAMAYSVYAVAAAEFMTAFYERLFAGDPVSMAVTAGRQRMFTRSMRPSPKGDMSLADWLIPVHYLRRDVSFPQARTTRAGSLPLDEILDQVRSARTGDGAGDLDAVGSFVGRDALFYELEVAARLQKVIVLHGAGGTGKTELAKAFGRWWRDTGGVRYPNWVFVHSFEPGLASFGLDGVINAIGARLFLGDFVKLDAADRRAVVEQMLAEERMLLIWDDFESVRSMPDPHGAAASLGKDGWRDIRRFLAQVAERGRSAVIITSRNPEKWVRDARRITVGGLTPPEAAEYADYLLAPYQGAARQRTNRAFGDLMEWLDGHPLSMRLILPHLDTATSSTLLDALRGTVPLPGSDEDEGERMLSLAASITYSYTHLAESTRCLLPAICLLQAIADADILMFFSRAPKVPARFRGATTEDWKNALDDASGAGLLTPLGAGMYRIHPALPAYLASQWRNEGPKGHKAERKQATRSLLSACADFSVWLTAQIESGDRQLAYTVLELQHRTLSSMLSYALAHGRWQEAEQIVEPLGQYWDVRGLTAEADAWADRILLATEDDDGAPPEVGTPAWTLWLAFTAQRADHRPGDRLHLDRIEDAYQRTRARLEADARSPQQQAQLAGIYGMLGRNASMRSDLDAAERWYRKSLAKWKKLGDKPRVAQVFHSLGRIAQERQLWDDAETWYRKSLAIEERLSDMPAREANYHQLGTVAIMLGKPQDAFGWYEKSLAILTDIGDRPGMATSYHNIGVLFYMLGRLDEAEQWERRALAIREELGDKPGIVRTFQALGLIAQARMQLDDAVDWYQQSLAVDNELTEWPGMVPTYTQLSALAEAQGQLKQALEWAIRSVAIFDSIPHPSAGNGPDMTARLTARLGLATLKECWQNVTGDPLPEVVRQYVKSHAPPAGG
jgi:tetratricopeptide (TPR) repeat protein